MNLAQINYDNTIGNFIQHSATNKSPIIGLQIQADAYTGPFLNIKVTITVDLDTGETEDFKKAIKLLFKPLLRSNESMRIWTNVEHKRVTLTLVNQAHTSPMSLEIANKDIFDVLAYIQAQYNI